MHSQRSGTRQLLGDCAAKNDGVRIWFSAASIAGLLLCVLLSSCNDARVASQNVAPRSTDLAGSSQSPRIDNLPLRRVHPNTNNLIHETSPYLLQHAHNPVNWFPWGDEAFALAKKENKPIFLSIGYSTCYWCHVMERESFESEDVAAILNENYVCIKVDREERPEVDAQYMLAAQLITGQGGWPNSVWLTPDGKPFMAGTYFPREPFKQALTQLADSWKNQRTLVDAQAEKVSAAMQRLSHDLPKSSERPGPAIFKASISEMRSTFDRLHGGFGGAPKFPPHGQLRLLAQLIAKDEAPELKEMFSITMDHLIRGGIRDHLGGGFHRYSTDERWQVPHFEKMLYDNAQLLDALVDAQTITSDNRYREAADELFAWLMREMTSPQGGFYSAIDSESQGIEGQFYVWTYAEIVDGLGPLDADPFARAYGVTENGNFSEKSGKLARANVLFLPQSIDALASQVGQERIELQNRLGTARARLFEIRLKRPQLHIDDKILSGWNGLMIGALARAGRTWKRPEYVAAAERAADFVVSQMQPEGKLMRSWRDGRAKQPAFLEDYAYLARGFVELYETTSNTKYLNQAVDWAQTTIKEFADSEQGGFYFTADQHDPLIPRSKHVFGGGDLPMPSGVAAEVLLRLARIENRPDFQAVALAAIDSSAWVMSESPRGSASMLSAVIVRDRLSTELALSLGAPQVKRTEGEGTERAAPTAADARVEQSPIDVELFASALQVKPGTQVNLAVRISIDGPWHLYGPNPELAFVQPTTVSTVESAQFHVDSVRAPNGTEQVDPILKKTVAVYQGEVWFVVLGTVAADAPQGDVPLTVHVRYQPCDDSRCLEVRTVELPLVLHVVPDQAPDEGRHASIFQSLEFTRQGPQ